jgi:hypothetical protein
MKKLIVRLFARLLRPAYDELRRQDAEEMRRMRGWWDRHSIPVGWSTGRESISMRRSSRSAP